MGQCKSVRKSEVSCEREERCSRLYKTKGRPLSATFHVYDNNLQWDLLNINTATEEELMTLQGITRHIAHNIIEYRQAIGGFRKVEDLALVSRVGASTLEHIRPEICVGSRKGGLRGGSQASSGNISLESFAVSENNHRYFRTSAKMINANTANVFQLMTAPGVSQEIAANIIHYRERKGLFKSMDDLLKVKGINPQKLAFIRVFITVNPPTLNGENLSLPTGTPLGCRNTIVSRISNHRRTLSAPCKYNIERIRHLDESSKDLYSFLSDHCRRPIVEETFNYLRNGKPVIRIGVWNLEGLTVEKVRNPGIQEIICRTILENGLTIIALQDVPSEVALTLLVTELNNPQQKLVRSWVGVKGKWSGVIPELPLRSGSSGFLFDTSHGVELQDASLLILPKDDDEYLQPLPSLCIGNFVVDGMKLTLVNHHLKDSCIDSRIGNLLTELMEYFPNELKSEKCVALVGDFCLPPTDPALEVLTNCHYSHLIPVNTVTNLKTKEQDSHCWANDEFKRSFTGHWGVVHDGLCHPAIPNGWMLGGLISWHCPVWVEMYVQNNVENKHEQLPNGQVKKSPSPGKIGPSSSINRDRSKKYLFEQSKRIKSCFRKHKDHNNSNILV
ncbi:endonuclease/exonuclease/phosphatase family domain-containing protein 1-like isoform X1 [Limulus polyphemus]|uniref:Endonuclease/exonuclease/phosphatase family domain-containing protein 1-like isoform X1 n=1 Tax=Limulus polyphemus TaxID=6850 RepID=A0ABM1SBP7_LIMPO|nr:endonuclease/exonuclease/phosphatase family domain-containing protein 1-like isoform X1 [Limulus polyphemus]XP_022241053.1 endonuclease/exonuclease/phosphatase family domain-containing protein 1-like isoform X1 [Limulus polyphemus]XP_022241054.1 endonuclease/exonuclease/phosphatase family domain-containing protein 1-like isoform X1 [Limulus polyphemus]XP_022241055.1 endonuclease/exonuclease/phosphatase family domain-containing protein 1-like isoform X1 [Limulus polyphemus]XP_022241057.1 endo